jgi:hypothetical protein
MKKLISILLSVVLVASVIVSASAMSLYPDGASLKDTLAAYEAETGEQVETHRLYFQMPNGQNGPVATEQVSYIPTIVDDEGNETPGEPVIVCDIGQKTPSWYNDYTQGAGVYYWGSAPCATDTWAGYKMEVVDAEHSIFCVDLPITSVLIFNNGVDGGMDASKPIYYMASQTIDVPCEYPDEGEWPGIMTGREEEEGFDGCIFVINPNEVDTSPTSHKMTCGGSWYFYYGDGCYGCYEADDDRHVCLNPDHYVGGDISGAHAGWQYGSGSSDPTEPDPQPTVKRADYDKDDKITIMDATRVQNILAKLYTEDESFLLGADADGDGKFTIMDATRIQNYLAKLMNLDGTTPYAG